MPRSSVFERSFALTLAQPSRHFGPVGSALMEACTRRKRFQARKAFAHRDFYTRGLYFFHAHGGFYFFHAQMPLHTEAIITQRRFYEQKAFAHRTLWTTGVFTQSCPYMPIHTAAFSYTQIFFHANNAFIQRRFYTQAL